MSHSQTSSRKKKCSVRLVSSVLGVSVVLLFVVLLVLFLVPDSGGRKSAHTNQRGKTQGDSSLLSYRMHASNQQTDSTQTQNQTTTRTLKHSGCLNVWAVRHGLAEHNVRGHHIRDPQLVSLGFKQCKQTGDALFAQLAKDGTVVDAVIASPLKRTIESALQIVADRQWPAIALHSDLQEATTQQCDTGVELSDLQKWYAAEGYDASKIHFDATRLPQKWYQKGDTGTRKRLDRFEQWLQTEAVRRQWHTVVIVAHGIVLKKWTQFDYGNAEARNFQYRFDANSQFARGTFQHQCDL